MCCDACSGAKAAAGGSSWFDRLQDPAIRLEATDPTPEDPAVATGELTIAWWLLILLLFLAAAGAWRIIGGD